MAVIWVDADACPVRSEVETVATRHGLPVTMVCNGGIRPSRNPLVQLVVVSDGPDVADRHIAESCGPGDIVVTADIPLAARAVEAGATVLKPTGEPLTAANVGQALATRDLMADLRAADPFRQGGGRGFTKADRQRFLNALEAACRRATRG